MKDILKQAEEKMQKSIHVLSDEFAAVRAGRANPAILDKVMVDYYGAPTAINQLAAVSVSEARVLVIQPWDVSSLESIEKAIQVADLGINPQNDGKVIRLTFPQLTEERRREIAKDIGKMCENGKVAIRSIRRDAIEKLKAMKKDGDITEDDLKDGEKKAQDLTDKYCKEADTMHTKKEKEILETIIIVGGNYYEIFCKPRGAYFAGASGHYYGRKRPLGKKTFYAALYGA